MDMSKEKVGLQKPILFVLPYYCYNPLDTCLVCEKTNHVKHPWKFGEFFLCNLYLGPGASDKPCNEVYQGASVMSEIEVQNVDRFLKSEQKRLVGFLDVHNYSQMWMIPWGYAKEHIKDYDELVSKSTI